jgi:hypothetical protein
VQTLLSRTLGGRFEHGEADLKRTLSIKHIAVHISQANVPYRSPLPKGSSLQIKGIVRNVGVVQKVDIVGTNEKKKAGTNERGVGIPHDE